MVLLISSSLCATDIKPASNADGARYTPSSSIIGTIWLRMSKQDNSTPIPFGPYLAIAGWIVFMWGEQLVDGYLRISGIR